jgi:hypothetical protein
MRFNSLSINEAQRRGYNALTANIIAEHDRKKGASGQPPVLTKKHVDNAMYVPPKLTSSPAMLVQELQWINTTTQFVFDFSIQGPGALPLSNNIAIGKNDVFAAYGFQFLFGTQSGAYLSSATNTAATVYRSHGVLPADDSFYNSVIQLKIESSTYIDKMEGQFYRDTPFNSNEYYGEIGLQLINPIRLVSGELGKFQLIVNLKNPIAGLVISANTILSCRMHGVYGQAQG